MINEDLVEKAAKYSDISTPKIERLKRGFTTEMTINNSPRVSERRYTLYPDELTSKIFTYTVLFQILLSHVIWTHHR
jgi:hypothetical protein